MYRQTGPSKGNRRAPVVAPGRSRPAAQRGGGGNKAAGSPVPTAANTPGITISPTGQVVESRSPALPGDGAEKWTTREEASARRSHRRVQQAERATTREERQKAAAALAQVAATQSKRARERANPQTPKPSSYLGRKTAGAPTKSELDRAHEAGLLKVNKAGALTTPSVRQSSRQLRKATAAVKRSTGLTGPLTPGQKTFAEQVARRTGLSPRVVGAQVLAEESGEAARRREAEGNHDWLNIGYYDSGPGAITRDPSWSNPHAAAKATAEFFKGRKFGPSSSIAAILPTSAGKPDAVQIAAIGNSDWATSGAYRTSIEGTHDLIGLRSNPRAQKKLAAATKAAKSLGLKPGAVTGTHSGPAPAKLVKRTVVAEHAMREIEGQPYIWGGGHGTFTGYGKDCSGAVGYVLHKVEPGRMTAPLTSGDMGQVLEPGPGALTVFYNDEHTFLRLINRKGEAEYWGTSVGDSGAGGLTRHPTPSSSYLAQYNVGHVPGMGKLQALQLGADPATVTGGGTSAGVTLGPSGTTATIAPGAGVVKKGKPGRSKRPIILTPLQRFNRAKRKLASVGAPISPSSSKSGRSESHPILEELKAKYGSAPTPAKQKAAEAAAA